jgi:hypothetical protein
VNGGAPVAPPPLAPGTPRGIARWLEGAALAAVLVAATAVNQSAVHWRSNIADDHLFAYYGWLLADGGRPYLDFWDNKPPGIWYLNAAAIAVCGPGIAADLLLGWVAVLLALAAFIGVAREVFGPALRWPAVLIAVVLLTHPLFECGGNRTETYVIVGELGALYGYLRWRRGGGPGWLVLAGLAAGAAPLFKQSGAAALAAISLHALVSQLRAPRRAWPWRAGLTFLAAAAATPLAVLVALLWHGAAAEAAFAVGRFNRAYFAVDDATWWRLDRAIQIYQPVFAHLRGLFLAAGIGVAAWGIARWRSPRTAADTTSTGPTGVGLVLLWGLLAAYLACVGPGRRGHHFMPALPPLGLLTLLPLSLLLAGRGLTARIVARPLVALLLVVWGYVIVDLGRVSLGELQRSWSGKPAWYALRHTTPPPFRAQGERIRELCPPDETIYVWGWSPGTYRYACRRPASRYATLEKLGQVREHAHFIRDAAIADIQARPPRIFVISLGDWDALQAAPRPPFGRWLGRHYAPRETVQGMHLLERTTTGGLDNPAPGS